MTPPAPTIRVISSPRRTHPLALAVFLVAYLGLLAVVFAPTSTPRPNSPTAPAAATLLR